MKPNRYMSTSRQQEQAAPLLSLWPDRPSTAITGMWQTIVSAHPSVHHPHRIALIQTFPNAKLHRPVPAIKCRLETHSFATHYRTRHSGARTTLRHHAHPLLLQQTAQRPRHFPRDQHRVAQLNVCTTPSPPLSSRTMALTPAQSRSDWWRSNRLPKPKTVPMLAGYQEQKPQKAPKPPKPARTFSSDFGAYPPAKVRRCTILLGRCVILARLRDVLMMLFEFVGFRAI